MPRVASGFLTRPALLARATAIVCSLALLVTPFCNAKCIQPGCATVANRSNEPSDDCHGSIAASGVADELGSMRSFHRCAASDPSPAILAEIKPGAAVEMNAAMNVAGGFTRHIMVASSISLDRFRPGFADPGSSCLPASPFSILRI